MRTLRNFTLLLLLLSAAATLSACGKKGPLYLPSPPPPHAPAQTK
ncbi:MAG: lipoprotein [Gammaproteobacteria bacterium]